MSAPRVILRKELKRAIRDGHPWIYADALRPVSLPTGTEVDITTGSGQFVARGLYDARSPIAVRIYTLDRSERIDGGLVRRRLEEALAARRGAIDPAETTAFRWSNGEGDYLPGVVVDLYADLAVVHFDGEAAATLRPAVVDALRGLGVARVYERAPSGGTALHGGEPPERIEVREAGIRLAVDPRHGQKTGAFLDQRENRRALRPYAKAIEVADLFCHAGGFSLHAALAGATRCTLVDSAPAALADARANFALNGLDPTVHAFEEADAFGWLAEARGAGRRFGLVIVDPPSFAPSERAVPRALNAYRQLHAAALEIVAPGGVIAAASCSSHVELETFLAVLGEGAVRAGRRLRILEVRGQPPDHPSLPAFPEGRYLKMIIARAG